MSVGSRMRTNVTQRTGIVRVRPKFERWRGHERSELRDDIAPTEEMGLDEHHYNWVDCIRQISRVTWLLHFNISQQNFLRLFYLGSDLRGEELRRVKHSCTATWASSHVMVEVEKQAGDLKRRRIYSGTTAHRPMSNIHHLTSRTPCHSSDRICYPSGGGSGGRGAMAESGWGDLN